MERVGVVVIHGVGETREGWIDQYLVPDFQRWSAYRAVGRAPDPKADRDMVLVVSAGDQIQLAIALDTDDHCARFFLLTGEDASLSEPQFATPLARRKHRDDFLDVVMSITSGETAEHWLRVLPEAGVPVARAFDLTSTVHRVRDPESSDPLRTWLAFQRVWPLPEREVRFTELYWADMSNIGGTIFARLAALFELMNEAPTYLGRALLADSTQGVHSIVRRLLVAANWMIRWPIVGLNTAVFLTAFLAIVAMNSGPWLAPFIAGCLALIGIGGLIVSNRHLHGRPGLADTALSTGIHALILLALLAVAAVSTIGLLPTTPEPYLVASIVILLAAWTLWTVPILLAIGLLTLIGFKRLGVRRRPTSPPLVRPGAALGLNLILAMLLKFLYAAFGLLVITTLVGPMPAGCPTTTPSSSEFTTGIHTYATASSACQLVMLKKLLLDVGAFNGLALALLFATALVVNGIRRAMTAALAKSAIAGTLRLPRLIAHPTILVVLALGAVVNAVLIYVPGMTELRLPSTILGGLRASGLEHVGASALIILVLGLAILVEMSGASLHIARDLVDHQYDRRENSWAMRLSLATKPTKHSDRQSRPYRRRVRIQRRLEALIENVITHQRCDRLIFLAHSQGTVILRDYLFDKDQLLADRQVQTEALSAVRRIDVVTLGSPLTHIYGHYFADVRPAGDALGRRPIDNVQSWTNLWRVDDPIGQFVTLGAGRDVVNRGLPPGGHIDYWGEPHVCELIWQLINGRPAETVASSAGQRGAIAAA